MAKLTCKEVSGQGRQGVTEVQLSLFIADVLNPTQETLAVVSVRVESSGTASETGPTAFAARCPAAARNFRITNSRFARPLLFSRFRALINHSTSINMFRVYIVIHLF